MNCLIIEALLLSSVAATSRIRQQVRGQASAPDVTSAQQRCQTAIHPLVLHSDAQTPNHQVTYNQVGCNIECSGSPKLSFASGNKVQYFLEQAEGTYTKDGSTSFDSGSRVEHQTETRRDKNFILNYLANTEVTYHPGSKTKSGENSFTNYGENAVVRHQKESTVIFGRSNNVNIGKNAVVHFSKGAIATFNPASNISFGQNSKIYFAGETIFGDACILTFYQDCEVHFSQGAVLRYGKGVVFVNKQLATFKNEDKATEIKEQPLTLIQQQNTSPNYGSVSNAADAKLRVTVAINNCN